MKLKKAIKHIERKIRQNVFQVDPDAFEALKISLEALKIIQKCRDDDTDINLDNLLPGETQG